VWRAWWGGWRKEFIDEGVEAAERAARSGCGPVWATMPRNSSPPQRPRRSPARKGCRRRCGRPCGEPGRRPHGRRWSFDLLEVVEVAEEDADGPAEPDPLFEAGFEAHVEVAGGWRGPVRGSRRARDLFEAGGFAADGEQAEVSEKPGWAAVMRPVSSRTGRRGRRRDAVAHPYDGGRPWPRGPGRPGGWRPTGQRSVAEAVAVLIDVDEDVVAASAGRERRAGG